MSRPPLYEYSGDDLVDFLEQAQAELRRQERHHARAKALFEALTAVLAEDRRHWDDKPLAGNVSGLVKELDAWMVGNEKYLGELVDYLEKKDAVKRASDRMSMWQTERKDNRKV